MTIINKYSTLGEINIYITFNNDKNVWNSKTLDEVYNMNKKGGLFLPKRNPEPYYQWIDRRIAQLVKDIEKYTNIPTTTKTDEEAFVKQISLTAKPTAKTQKLLQNIEQRRHSKTFFIKNPIIRAIYEKRKTQTRAIKPTNIVINDGYFLIDYNNDERIFKEISIQYKVYNLNKHLKNPSRQFIKMRTLLLLENFANEYLRYVKRTILDGKRLKPISERTKKLRKRMQKNNALPIASLTTPLYATGNMLANMVCNVDINKKTLISVH